MLISICIPAFKRTKYLKRLLDSVREQIFSDYEVIITDDSPGNEVKSACEIYEHNFHLRYQKNPAPLGTPENWNAAIRLAKGEWIKIMHDDDWFADPNSLTEYVDAIKQNPNAEFFFSAYNNVYENSSRTEEVFIIRNRFQLLKKNPATLFSSNVIGPPSVILHKNDNKFWYDPKIKWVVDIDFYIRYLKATEPVYIPKALINVGMHEEQVTTSAFRVSEVEVPENFYLLNKTGTSQLKSILIYDAWWRLMRNLRIRNEQQIRSAGYEGDIPSPVLSMIHWQKHFPKQLLKNGVISKLSMFANYLRNYLRIR